MIRFGWYVRRAGAVAGAALAATIGLPLTSMAAGGSHWMMSGDYTETHQSAYPCADGAQGCYAVVTLHVPAHQVLQVEQSVAVTAARACSTQHVYPWVQFVYYGAMGQVAYTVRMDNEDWYDGCSSAGNVYVNATCHPGPGSPWTCGSSWKGSFWDGSRDANTDWNNRDTVIPGPTGTDCTELRTWTSPSGGVTWATYHTSGTSCGG
jgi:hypothetical protein